MNVFTFTGNLGQDCRQSSAGSTAVCNFSVAVKSGYGDKEQTVWIDVALWGKQAEGRLPDYLLKGQQVAVSGELGTREYEGKTYLTCRANSVSLIGGRDKTQENNDPPPKASQATAKSFDELDDDIPF